MTNWRATSHLGMGRGGPTDPCNKIHAEAARKR
jgi:hypothetical protein